MRRNRGWGKPRRLRVALRPAARRRRRAEAAAVVAVLVLGVLAFGVARHFPRGEFSISGLASRAPIPSFSRVEEVSVTGAPAPLEREMVAEIGTPLRRQWGFFELYRTARRLRNRFPCAESVAVRWDWSNHKAAFQVALRRPLAAIFRDGKREGWLADSGIFFTAPEGVFPEPPAVAVELRGGPARRPGALVPGSGGTDVNYPALAQMLKEASKPGALPSPPANAELRPDEGGWQVRLADGTKVLWGNLNWTDEKLRRLRQVLSDASGKYGGGLTADLRYFEYGKILVRPLKAAPGRVIHG